MLQTPESVSQTEATLIFQWWITHGRLCKEYRGQHLFWRKSCLKFLALETHFHSSPLICGLEFSFSTIWIQRICIMQWSWQLKKKHHNLHRMLLSYKLPYKSFYLYSCATEFKSFSALSSVCIISLHNKRKMYINISFPRKPYVPEFLYFLNIFLI